MTTTEQSTDTTTEDTTQAPETAQETPATEEPATDQPDTFPRAYVEELRQENGKHRTRARRLAVALTSSMADRLGVLHDATDLPFDDGLIGEDGMPDPARVEAAVTELVRAKPHLARIRPTGDVGQGSTGAPREAGLLDIFNGRG